MGAVRIWPPVASLQYALLRMHPGLSEWAKANRQKGRRIRVSDACPMLAGSVTVCSGCKAAGVMVRGICYVCGVLTMLHAGRTAPWCCDCAERSFLFLPEARNGPAKPVAHRAESEKPRRLKLCDRTLPWPPAREPGEFSSGLGFRFGLPEGEQSLVSLPRNGDRDAAAKLTREKRFILDSISKRQSTPAGHDLFKGYSKDEMRALFAAVIMHGKEVGTVCLQCSKYNETPAGRERMSRAAFDALLHIAPRVTSHDVQGPRDTCGIR